MPLRDRSRLDLPCREPQNGQTPQPGDIVVTGVRCNAACQANLRRQELEKWVVLTNRYVLNPYYRDPAPWLNLENFVIAQGVLGSIAVTPGIPALTARGTGLLNSNDYVRWGYSWSGSAQTGRSVFRLGIGKRWLHPLEW